MFKKLVSNLPFNPSLIEHFPEYRAALKKERDLRIVGLAILSLAFLGQLFISLFPATPTLASSPNDLIRGGFSSPRQASKDCQYNQNYRQVLGRFGISCRDIQEAKPVSIRATSYSKNLYSLNRIAYGQNPESQIRISGSSYYLRQLWQGSGLSSVSLNALSGVSGSGLKYFILYNSADLAFIGQPTTSLACGSGSGLSCPELSITARSGQINNANNTTLGRGNIVIYTLVATNLSKKTLNNFVVGTNFGSALAYSKLLNLYGASINDNFIAWPATSILPNQTITRSVSFEVTDQFPDTPLSASDPNYYNNKMVTSYGNTLSIKLPWTFAKFYELKINNNLPSQTLVVSLIVSILLILVVCHFLARNLQLLRELNHVKEDYLRGNKD